jgi:hypothetical protein
MEARIRKELELQKNEKNTEKQEQAIQMRLSLSGGNLKMRI